MAEVNDIVGFGHGKIVYCRDAWLHINKSVGSYRRRPKTRNRSCRNWYSMWEDISELLSMWLISFAVSIGELEA